MSDITIEAFEDEVTTFLDANGDAQGGRAHLRVGRGHR